MNPNEDVRSFLKSRRARVEPEQVGFRTGSRRRVPGLRREEVAALAHISVDYYTQLEQGRGIRPTAAVLASIADALRLDDSERSYLARLMRDDEVIDGAAGLRSGLRDVLDGMHMQGALIVDHRMRVLAANRIADALMGGWIAAGEHDGNLAAYVFEDPESAATHPDWEEVAESMVATLRFGATRWRGDAALERLIRRLHASERFAVLWQQHDVTANTSGAKRFRIGGRAVEVRYEVLVPPSNPRVRLVVYSAARDTTAFDVFTRIRDASAPEVPWVVIPAPPSDPTSPTTRPPDSLGV